MPVILEGTPYSYKYAEAGVPDYPAGTLLMEENGGYAGTVYVVDYQNKLRWFRTALQFEQLGFKWDQIIKVPESVLQAYDVNNAVQITDTNPPILVVPPAKAKVDTKLIIVFGALLLISFVIYKLKKSKKG